MSELYYTPFHSCYAACSFPDTGPINSRFWPCLACCQPTGPYAAKPQSQGHNETEDRTSSPYITQPLDFVVPQGDPKVSLCFYEAKLA